MCSQPRFPSRRIRAAPPFIAFWARQLLGVRPPISEYQSPISIAVRWLRRAMISSLQTDRQETNSFTKFLICLPEIGNMIRNHTRSSLMVWRISICIFFVISVVPTHPVLNDASSKNSPVELRQTPGKLKCLGQSGTELIQASVVSV